MATGRILVADEDPSITALLRHRLERDGHEVEIAGDGEAAWASLRARPFDLLVTDVRMERMDGLELLRRVRAFDADLPVLVTAAHGSIAAAVEAIRDGAWDYVEKPIVYERLRAIVAQVLEHRAMVDRVRAEDRRVAKEGPGLALGIVARSAAMRSVLQVVERVARYNAPVLITGESGTGKELVARAVHALSPRARRPFVAVNGAGIVDTLFESLLFGHQKGAFTGAAATHRGWMVAATGGTLLLDEIGEMPLGQQTRLLRALETGEILPVGATEAVTVDVRIVTATNRDLTRAIAERAFREDLYYRLRGAVVHIPPLRERREDVAPLAAAFLARFNEENGRDLEGFEPDAARALEENGWPGNARELRQVVVEAAMLADGPRITRRDLAVAAPALGSARPAALPHPSRGAHGAGDEDLRLDRVEHDHVARVLGLARGNRTEAAARLGISRHALYRLLRRHGIG